MSSISTERAADFQREIRSRVRVEHAAEILGLGRMWPERTRRDTLARVRRLPTYERESDTVIVCHYSDPRE